MKALLIFLAALAAFTMPSTAAEFWAERPSYLRLFSSRLPRITGQVTLSPIQVLQSEVELFDLKPDMLEYAEHLARHQSLTYRINLITNGKLQVMWSQTRICRYAPPDIGPEFTLIDGWWNETVCLLVIQHSVHAQIKVLLRQSNGEWKVLQDKAVAGGTSQPCSIRKTSPPAIVQNDWVDNVVTPVIRFYLATDQLVPVPPPYPVPDPFSRGM